MKPRFIALALLASLNACGGFSGDPGEPTVLATVKGEITNPNQIEAPQSLRVALIWGGVQYNVAQELEVVPEFPARFALQIDQLPPEDALMDSEDDEVLSPGMRVAFGGAVGYVDVNQNGRLDMVEIGAESYVDQLVATNEETAILYVEATDAALAQFEQRTGLRPPRGFGFFRRGTDAPTTFPPLTDDYELFLDEDPTLNELMCRDIRRGIPGSGALDNPGTPYPSGGSIVQRDGRPETYPSPTDPNLICHPGGASYWMSACETISNGPCRGGVISCRYDEWLRPQPVPPDWPCQGS
jgi:hypothetical protein